MKLYSGPLSMFSAKAEIALIEKGIDYEIEYVPFSIAKLYTPKHPQVVRINPKQQVPVLIDGDVEIYDSTQIFEYLEDVRPEPPLWPRDQRARARARQLELESDEVFFANVVFLMPGQRQAAGEARVEQAIGDIHRCYDDRERLLAGREYMTGELGYADIAFYMAQFFAGFLGEPWKDGHPRLDAWRARLRARPSFARVAGAMAEYLGKHGIPTPSF